MRIGPRYTVACLVGAVALAGCGSGTSTSSTESSPTATADSVSVTPSGPADSPATGSDQSPAPGTDAIPAALAVKAPTVSDGDLDLASFAGQHVALWFWAPT